MKLSHLEQIKSLAIVGATGLVGKEVLDILSEKKIRIPLLRLLASENSAGETMDAFDEGLDVQELSEESFIGVEAAIFSVPDKVTEAFLPAALKAGAIVIDDSAAFRMQPNVPLVVPEVNASVLREYSGSLISTPNCTVTPLALILKPLLDSFGLKRVVVSSYQSVSGAGKKAFEELSSQSAALLGGEHKEPEAFKHPIAFNLLPVIGNVMPGEDSEEEKKIVREVKKILSLPKLKVSATAIRVPTFCGHGISANIEFESSFEEIEEVREKLDAFAGIKVLDRPDSHIYPTNRECVGSDYTFVGRIRRDHSVVSGINIWIMSDNLRKGAALNALECLDSLLYYRSLS